MQVSLRTITILLVSFVSAVHGMDNSPEAIWSESLPAREVYDEYLTYLNEPGCDELAQEKADIIEALKSKYAPLSSYLDGDGYCSRLTIKNLRAEEVKFKFHTEVPWRTLRIIADKRQAQKVKMAYRTIVPIECRSCPQVAGPMGYHEYLIDGSTFKDSGELGLIFFIHPETPIKIDLQNCKGKWEIPTSMSDKFVGIENLKRN